MIDKNRSINPILFDKSLQNKYIFINGELFIEISNDIVPNIRPGQYINIFGVVFDKVTGITRIPFLSSCGSTYGEYYRVNLADINGKYFNKYTHRLIMMIFNPVNNMSNLVVNHLDGNKTNNFILNMEWTTVGGNIKHAYDNGLRSVGEDHHMAKLTEQEVLEICAELSKPRYKGQFEDIARKYNVASSDISSIACGKIWRSVTERFGLDYSIPGTTSKLTDEEVREICKDLENPYPHQTQELSKKYNISNSMINLIRTGKYHSEIVREYNIPCSQPRQYFSIDDVHNICKIIENHGCWNNDTYNDIINQLNFKSSTELRMRIKAIYNRNSFCNISSQYKW